MPQNVAEQPELELELPEGEIDNSEADVSADIEAANEETVEQTEEEHRPSAEERLQKMMEDDDELREYGDGVKKRIDKLTYKYREAERREQAAIEYAQAVQAQLEQQKQQNRSQDNTLFQEYTSRIDTQLAQAKANYKVAFDSGDPDAIADANQELARLSVEQENLRRVKARREQEASMPQHYQQPVPQAPQQAPRPDPKAEEWAERNSWFGEDEAMTYAAFGIHRNLVEREKVDPTSDAYYTELDKRMREAFPQKFQQTNRPVQSVASATRSNPKQQSARKVKLSPSEIAIANRLGVPLEEYAKYVKR